MKCHFGVVWKEQIKYLRLPWPFISAASPSDQQEVYCGHMGCRLWDLCDWRLGQSLWTSPVVTSCTLKTKQDNLNSEGHSVATWLN